ncbi:MULTISPECIES: TetR/AcrR family transcriptional regulator [Enterococcus]|uniref:TetR/AcrR family transcriptional regulator n=1 Tax=Candidatus Enterococcus murrayae TaxID=2815321 RepID=A0ABS3HL90_9ENTE|nr:TetR/AcrR family transcriptional regulator [Enterococcus sp. MJM16]MBO0454201.1 TetR/AcrR family transcriptional regulator [Enterococcus sp. MJM16]
MSKQNTKEKILLSALELFSTKGYEGTSVRDLARAVGIRESSLYKHFKNKQAIFDAILAYMESYHNEKMKEMAMPLGRFEEIAGDYSELSLDHLYQISSALFLMSFKDTVEIQFRRMLTIEQFSNPEIKASYKKYFISDILHYQTMLFSEMIQQGRFIECDPKVLALQFYSPIYTLLALYEGQLEKEEEALAILKEHIFQFDKRYSSEGK